MATLIKLDRISTTGCQSRETTCNDTVKEYAEAWREREKFPPVVLFDDGETCWVGDGTHRILAALKAELDTIPAVVQKGTTRDALLHAASANKTNGLRRTNADKRKSVMIVLELEPEWSDRRIAEHVGVSHTFVAKLREEVCRPESGGNGCHLNTRLGKDGKEYPVGLGAEQPASEPGEEATNIAWGVNALVTARKDDGLSKTRDEQAPPVGLEGLKLSKSDLDIGRRNIGTLIRFLQRVNLYGRLQTVREIAEFFEQRR